MRNFQDPLYKKVRAIVLKRDGYKCKKCESNKRLQVHHIKTWADHPTLRYAENNLITLCKKCHQKLWGNEGTYEGYCYALLGEGGGVHNLFGKYD